MKTNTDHWLLESVAAATSDAIIPPAGDITTPATSANRQGEHLEIADSKGIAARSRPVQPAKGFSNYSDAFDYMIVS